MSSPYHHGSPKKATPVYKRPTMTYTPIKPMPTRSERLSSDLGLEYEGLGTNLLSVASSSDDENVNPDSDSTLGVKYQALKRQLKHIYSERDNLQLRVSKLKEKLKQNEKQLQKEESDRKNQLNIMKNTHDQSFNEKNRIIQLLESVLKEQETELEIARMYNPQEMHGNMLTGAPESAASLAITGLTGQLNHVIQEKNNIMGQFFSQQILIKQQQIELKGLLRCKSENTDLTSQISTHTRTVSALKKEIEDYRRQVSENAVEVALLKNDVDALQNTSPRSNSSSSGAKLEEKITKLQDKLLIKEAEYMEMDFEHRKTIQRLEESDIEKEQQIRQLKLDSHQQMQNSQMVESEPESPSENEVLRNQMSVLQTELESLNAELTKVNSRHKTEIQSIEKQNKKSQSVLEKELSEMKLSYQEIQDSVKSGEEKQSADEKNHKKTVSELEKQVKQRKADLVKLRQEMADKVAELEQQRDTDLEELETQYKARIGDAASENQSLRQQITASVIPQLTELKTQYKRLQGVCRELPKCFQTEFQRKTRELNAAILSIHEQNKDLVGKYRKEMKLRKKYHNQLVELKGNIRVFCRIRPLIAEDGASPHNAVLQNEYDADVVIVENKKGRSQQFEMDRLFNPASTQTQVFDEVQDLVASVIDGYHVCIFAYGQTGSGKTYTMEGVEANPGINQRALLKLFNETERMGHEWRFDIRVSVLEIYNESVRDLLVGDSPEKLDIKLNTDGTLYVPGLSWVAVSNVDDVNRVFTIGHDNRATASTNMNEHSSRSHALLCVEIVGENLTTGVKTFGKLNLVDLAGSERVSKSGADGARLKEAQAINKSLSALGDVISALRSKQQFVPYRNSKLTYLLQDSLGGDSKVLMIVQVAPVESHVNETLCSLNFAQRVRSVELGMAQKRQEGSDLANSKARLTQNERSSPISTPTKSSSTPHGTPRRK